MKLHRLAGAIASALLIGSTSAPAITSWDAAIGLGSIIASERACALSLDRQAITRWIEANIDPKDMRFTENLALHVRVKSRELAEMNQTMKEAGDERGFALASLYGDQPQLLAARPFSPAADRLLPPWHDWHARKAAPGDFQWRYSTCKATRRSFNPAEARGPCRSRRSCRRHLEARP
jgi:hypothetical protein